jgi:hypothetical protein
MAILTAADLVQGLSNDIIPYLDLGGAARPADSLLGQLLLKGGSNDKRFVIDEVDRALSKMTQSLNAKGLIDMLVPYSAHKGPKVKHMSALPRFETAQTMSTLPQCSLKRLLRVCPSTQTLCG